MALLYTPSSALLSLALILLRSTEYGATIHAAFSLAFAGFLRIGKFTSSQSDLNNPEFDRWHIARVTLHKDHMELSLPSSKTGPFRCGILLTIAAADDDSCQVRSLRRLFERYPTPPPILSSSAQYFTHQFVRDTIRSK